jgi:hypothetical protein
VKVGAENRTKLIAAVALGVLALGLAATRFSTFFGGGSSDVTSASATHEMPSADELSNQPTQSTSRKNSRSRSTGKKPSGASSLDPTLHLDLLKASEDTKYEGTGRNIFRVFVEPPPTIVKSPVLDHKVADNTPPPPPPPPPSNLKFYGFATSRPDGAKRIFLYKNEDVFVASEGDIVDRRYKVVRISPNAVEILDVLSNNRENIPLSQG